VPHVPSLWLSVLLVPSVSAVARLPAAVHVLYAAVLAVLLAARPQPLSLQPAVHTSHVTVSHSITTLPRQSVKQLTVQQF